MFCLNNGHMTNNRQPEYFSKLYEMLPRNFSVTFEVAEMRYRFRIICRKRFDLINSGDFSFHCASEYVKGINFDTAHIDLQNPELSLNRMSCLSVKPF
jgi:hypothetical protein